jgi:hypothetical protein
VKGALMNIPSRMMATALLASGGTILLSACDKSGPANRVDNLSEPGTQPDSSESTPVPDACTFIPKAELERLVGRELRDGDRNDAPAGFSQCDFETPTGSATTRTFDNPPLPDAAGFSSVTITTHPTSAQTFAQSRQAIGSAAEPVTGIGDAAYFEGAGTIHVRAGNRGLGIRLHVSEPETEAGRQTLRKVMLSLATSGAARL